MWHVHTPALKGLLLLSLLMVGAGARAADTLLDVKATCHEIIPPINLKPGQAELLVVLQPGIDMRLVVSEGDDRYTVNAPASRYGPEFVYLDADSIAKTYKFCAYSMPDYALAPGVKDIVVKRLSLSLRDRDYARLLDKAGRLYFDADSLSRAEAIALYAEFSEVESPISPGLAEWRDTGRYYAAIGEVALYDYQKAALHLKKIPKQSLDVHLAYLRFWLDAKLLMPDKKQSLEVRGLLEQALEVATNLGAVNDAAMIHSMIAETYLDQGEISRGEFHIDRAVDLAKQDAALLGPIYNNKGYVWIRKSQVVKQADQKRKLLSEAALINRAAIAYAEVAGDLSTLALVLNNLAYVQSQLGDLYHAQQSYRTSLTIAEQIDSPRSDAMLYMNIGAINLALGDYDKAEVFLSRGSNMLRGAEFFQGITAECGLGTLYRLTDRLDLAIQHHEICLSIAERINSQTSIAAAKLGLALDYRDLKQWDRAWELSSQAKHLLTQSYEANRAQRVGAKYARTLAYHSLLAAQRGQADVAREDIQASIRISAGFLSQTLTVELLDIAMQVYQLLGDKAEARATGFKALAAIERIHLDLEYQSMGPAWAARTAHIFEQLSELVYDRSGLDSELVTGKRLASLFEIAERSRAIHLHRSMLDDKERAGSAERIKRLAGLADDRAGNHDESIAGDLARVHYREQDLYYAAMGEGSRSTQVAPVITQSEAQARLKTGEAVVIYQKIGEDLFALLLDQSGTRLIRLGKSANLLSASLEFRTDLANRAKLSVEILTTLSGLLPTELQKQGYNKLYILPYGDLYNLPFAALKFADGEPLIREISPVIVPSLSILFSEKAEQHYEHDLAIIADPAFAEASISPALDDGLRSWSNELTRLPWTAEEARQLGRQFADQRVITFTGDAATRENLFATRVRKSKVLHIATHGYFKASSPDNVGFLLSGKASADEPFTFITLTELFAHRFDNKLVVVSGCETALGKTAGGEGNLSISRAFVARGARNVIATLWPISDRATAKFMNVFYGYLKEGLDIADALRLAQLKLQKTPRYRDPFYWGAFFLTSVDADENIVFSKD